MAKKSASCPRGGSVRLRRGASPQHLLRMACDSPCRSGRDEQRAPTLPCVIAPSLRPRLVLQAREWSLARQRPSTSSSSSDIQYFPHFAGVPCASNGAPRAAPPALLSPPPTDPPTPRPRPLPPPPYPTPLMIGFLSGFRQARARGAPPAPSAGTIAGPGGAVADA